MVEHYKPFGVKEHRHTCHIVYNNYKMIASQMNLLVPENETDRLSALKEYRLLDSLPEEQFDRLTKLASIICQTPIALISFVDNDRQWFKSKIGLQMNQTARDISFCQYTILGDDFFEVEDALADTRFSKSALVLGNPNIRFYAAYPLKDPQGYNLGSLCVIDQTPKKLSEYQKEALKTLSEDIMLQIVANKKNDERRKLEKLFMMSVDLICIAGLDGYFKKINPSFTKTLGWSEEELLSRPFIEFVHPEDVSKTQQEIQNLANGISTVDFFTRFKTKDGNSCVLQWAANSDTVNGELFAIARDITEQNEVKESLKKAKEDADKARLMQEQFLANMSHEIRTPMNAIIGFTSFLKDTNLNHKQQEFVSNINIASENLLSIINDILDVSKIESGMLQIENTVLNLHSTLQSVYSLMLGRASEKKLELSLHINKDVPEFVISDPTRLSQILINLVSNAIKFTSDGFVNMRVEIDKMNSVSCIVRFIIQDSGIGIAKENSEIIFERFKQESADTTRKYGGTGLGLSIVKNITHLMGGEISINSTVGKGSEFIVCLPFTNCDESQQIEFKRNVEKGRSSTDIAPVNLNILLVEDNRMNQQYCKTLLKQFGYSCSLANNGVEAIKLLEENHYDLILMDIQMPLMDGYETTRQIRNKFKSDVYIIALTANAMSEEKNKCFAVGMNSYLSKPFKSEDLYLKIMEMFVVKKNEKSIEGESEQSAFKSLIDLEFIKSQVHGDSEAADELIEIFLNDVPAELLKLKEAIEVLNYDMINELSHKMVSNFSIIGINDAIEILRRLEHYSLRKENSEMYSELVNKLISIFNKLTNEINS
jgi:PAS domain S-box-containing protein